ncbi:MAG: hypothetical protein LBR56_07580 [Sporomusaceae bacterium]|jgi:hypothetical protein|nr:hypothetical protein [Sporomusaceae bacterium]
MVLLLIKVFKSDDEYIFIPSGQDKVGIRRVLDYFKKIGVNADKEILGEFAKKVFDYCKEHWFIENPDLDFDVYVNATGKKWSKFFKAHNCVPIMLDPEKGFDVHPYFKNERYKSYGITKDDVYPIYKLPVDCSDEELGEKIMKSFTFLEQIE